MNILSIDPGNKQSGYYYVSKKDKRLFDLIDNEILLNLINKQYGIIDKLVIEMVASYGMAVGQTIFDTCVWIGRFQQVAVMNNIEVELVYRKDVKLHLCNSVRAKDSNVKQALIDRFAMNPNINHGKGHKSSPDFFYGFKKDIWQAFALWVYYNDIQEVKK